ncbi:MULTISPECIES: hypothetical protein [unclassified Bradyrhizobium]|nr:MULTISPECIES: hypothetical protein [unclassified Bradyrhizobium]
MTLPMLYSSLAAIIWVSLAGMPLEMDLDAVEVDIGRVMPVND